MASDCGSVVVVPRCVHPRAAQLAGFVVLIARVPSGLPPRATCAPLARCSCCSAAACWAPAAAPAGASLQLHPDTAHDSRRSSDHALHWHAMHWMQQLELLVVQKLASTRRFGHPTEAGEIGWSAGAHVKYTVQAAVPYPQLLRAVGRGDAAATQGAAARDRR